MKSSYLVALVLVCCSSWLAPETEAQVIADTHRLTLDGARVIAAAAEAEAVRNGWNVVLVVADAGGHLLYLQRMDGVQLASLEIAQHKARTAALYRRPTKAFADRLSDGNQAVLVLPNALPLEGGLPIVVGDEVLGAVGVSGVRGDQDAQIAQAGLDALRARLGE